MGGGHCRAARSPTTDPPKKCPAANAETAKKEITIKDNKPASAIPPKFSANKVSKAAMSALPEMAFIGWLKRSVHRGAKRPIIAPIISGMRTVCAMSLLLRTVEHLRHASEGEPSEWLGKWES